MIRTATNNGSIAKTLLRDAFANTTRQRGSMAVAADAERTLSEIGTNPTLERLWQSYQQKFDYASTIEWAEAMDRVVYLCKEAMKRD